MTDRTKIAGLLGLADALVPGGLAAFDEIDKAADSHPSLRRGRVWCRECGATQRVNSAECLRSGWPLCCGETMTIDQPKETT